jgi:menaquinone-dependent protoporphyrinogen oxidase
MRVRIAYASEHGSTKGVAERLAHVLTEEGLEVACASVEEAPDLGECDAVVLGSAVHNRAWLPPAKDFLVRQQLAIRDRPTWLFSIGMPAALRRPLRRMATRQEQLRLMRDLQILARPKGHRLFSGVFERADAGGIPGQLLFWAVSGHYGDFRDWDAIDAWAHALAADLTKTAA